MRRALFVALLWCVGLSIAMAQTRSVTGTVRDAEGNTPIGSATIKAVVSQQTTSSSVDGTFSIEVASGGDSLIVTYLGYDQAVIAVGANTNNLSVDLVSSSE